MKKQILVFIFSLFCAMAWSQGTVSRLAFNSGGAAATSLGISIGEPILGRSSQVTLGSQQGQTYYPVGIAKIDADSYAKVFPNPFTNEFTVTVNGHAENNFSVRVVNVMGQEIVSQSGLNRTYLCNFSQYSRGTYFISVTNSKGEKIISKTIIKI